MGVSENICQSSRKLPPGIRVHSAKDLEWTHWISPRAILAWYCCAEELLKVASFPGAGVYDSVRHGHRWQLYMCCKQPIPNPTRIVLTWQTTLVSGLVSFSLRYSYWVSGRSFVPGEKHDTYPAIDPAKADLSGKVVLITGASRGIGKATALAVAQAGAKGLVLFARSDLSAVKAACLAAQRPGLPLDVLALTVDVGNNDQVVTGVKKAEETFGRLDVVINNAGYAPLCGSIADTDPKDWMAPWIINVVGTYHVVRAALPLLLKCDGDKTIINVSSGGANVVYPGWSAYQVCDYSTIYRPESHTIFFTDLQARNFALHRVHQRRIRSPRCHSVFHRSRCGLDGNACNRWYP